VKPELEFEVTDWANETDVLQVRVYGTVNGQAFDQKITLPEPMTIAEVHKFIARANSGGIRS
jgi:hypothetical protein